MSALPLLLVQGKGVDDEKIAALLTSPRVRVFRAPDLQSSPTSFARKNARATLVATLDEPLREVVFIRTSGFTGPLLLAVAHKYVNLSDDVIDSGALACLTLPIDTHDLDGALDLVAMQPVPPLAHSGLDLSLDPIDHMVRHRASAVRVTPREFGVLHCLIVNGARPVTVQQIYDYVWGSVKAGDTMRENVHVTVSQLRKKLAGIGLRKAIRTYRHYGYGLRIEVTSE